MVVYLLGKIEVDGWMIEELMGAAGVLDGFTSTLLPREIKAERTEINFNSESEDTSDTYDDTKQLYIRSGSGSGSQPHRQIRSANVCCLVEGLKLFSLVVRLVVVFTLLSTMDAERVRAYLQVACAGLGFDIGEIWWTSNENGSSTVAAIGTLTNSRHFG